MPGSITTTPRAPIAGETPLARWLADAAPVREVPATDLRFLLFAGAERRITKHGIRFGGLHFIAPELNGRVGQLVDVRWKAGVRRARGCSFVVGQRFEVAATVRYAENQHVFAVDAVHDDVRLNGITSPASA